MAARSKSTSSHSQIRWMAIAMTLWSWVIGIVFLTQSRRLPLSQAAAVAAVSCLGGLITWAIYHAISRRDDGMAFFIFALGGLVRQDTLSVSAAVVMQIAMGLGALLAVTFVWLLGKLLRVVFIPLRRVLFRRPGADDV